jgi:hypothetical protein
MAESYTFRERTLCRKELDHCNRVPHCSFMRKAHVQILSLAGIAAGLAAAYIVPSLLRPPPWPPATIGEVREALFEELRTVTLSNCMLKRYGGANDGGYLMCENLTDGVKSAYSYGIDQDDNWGCDVSQQLGVAIHQYDCFTSHRPVCEGGRFVFHDECVGPRAATNDGQPFDTILSQIARNGDTGKSLLLKIDIEGAEWDSLMATPDAVLERIVQMPMELHGTDEVKFVELARRLKRQFYLVNLHFNNFACTAGIEPFPAFAFQVLWVNKRIGVLDPDGPSPAPISPLNAPDRPDAPDCQLASHTP